MGTKCRGNRWKFAAVVTSALFLPTATFSAEVVGAAKAGGSGASSGAHSSPSVAPGSTAAPAAPSTPSTPTQSPGGSTPTQSPGTPAPTQSPGTPGPTQSPGLSPTQSPQQTPPQNSNPSPLPGNQPQNNVGSSSHHRGDEQLLPGYYGSNYWGNSWYNDQSQYYGQSGQNNQNGYADQQQQQSNQTVSPNQSPALIEPPRQADSPSLSAALQASPAFMEADVQEREAQTAYDAASQKVIDKLKQSPDYQQALQRKNADAAKVSANKAADPSVSLEKVEPAAQAKLDAAKAVTDMEREALASDPQTVAAKSKLDIAVAKRNAIKAQIQGSLPNAAVKH